MLAVKAPPGSELTIPDPYRGIQQGQAGSGRFRAFLKSKTGPLAVWLVAGGVDKSAAGAHQGHTVRLQLGPCCLISPRYDAQ